MKIILITILFFVAVLPARLYAQQKEDKLDLPGDNLNLYAVLKLFQESETLEKFEQKLNEENSEINNLDLDGDDKTDYIKVLDNVDDDVHTIVLHTDVSANEKQDVAVFTVQKDAAGKVQVQLREKVEAGRNEDVNYAFARHAQGNSRLGCDGNHHPGLRSLRSAEPVRNRRCPPAGGVNRIASNVMRFMHSSCRLRWP